MLKFFVCINPIPTRYIEVSKLICNQFKLMLILHECDREKKKYRNAEYKAADIWHSAQQI